MLQAEEASWVGLTLQEAEVKQMFLEEAREERKTEPLKYTYMHELVNELDGQYLLSNIAKLSCSCQPLRLINCVC